jgi:hypothetical protein
MTGKTVTDQASTLWRLQRSQHEVSCLVRLVPYAIEIDIAHDGVVILTRAFETDKEALAWAARKRAAREADGWTEIGSPTDGTMPSA